MIFNLPISNKNRTLTFFGNFWPNMSSCRLKTDFSEIWCQERHFYIQLVYFQWRSKSEFFYLFQKFWPWVNSSDIDTIFWVPIMISVILIYNFFTWREILNLTSHSKFWPPVTSNDLIFSLFRSLKMFTLYLADSWSSAYHQYTHDNKTEFPNEVNILERFNIYQEIFLALIYKTFQNWITLRPILFYAYSVFNLQAMYSFVLYATAWTLTGNWLTAIPTAVYFTFSRFDMTRVEFTVPLRER